MVEDQTEFFLKTVEEKHRKAVEATKNFINVFMSPSPEISRKNAAEEALNAVTMLSGILHSELTPQWVLRLKNRLTIVQQKGCGPSSTNEATEVATILYPKMSDQKWRGGDELKFAFDFDGLFEHYKQINKIPELFDRVLAYLEEVLASGAIDSRKAHNELIRVIQTLKSSRDGSYASTCFGWQFASTWIRTTLWEAAGEIPVAGSVFKGLREALKEAESAVQLANEQMLEDMRSQLVPNFPSIELGKTADEPLDVVASEIVPHGE